MQIKELLLVAKSKLKNISETKNLDAEILLAEVLKKPWGYLFTYPEKKISKKNQKKFWQFIKRRKNYEPIAYIIGKKEFYGLEFVVNKNVLIPRPETEILVDKVLKIVKKYKKNKSEIEIIDIGTGSGCIAISIAKQLQISNPKFSVLSFDQNRKISNKIIGIDKSKKALKIAKKNAKKHNVEMQFIQSDLLSKISNSSWPVLTRTSKFQTPIIVANLPYIYDKDKLPNSVEKYEPHLALFGGKKGLDLYEKLFKQIADKFPNFLSVIFECDPRQKKDLAKLSKKFLAQRKIVFFKDLFGKIRGGEIF